MNDLKALLPHRLRLWADAAPFREMREAMIEEANQIEALTAQRDEALRLLRYLWQEADVELRPIAGKKVCDLFDANDPLTVDIDAFLRATGEEGL